MRLHKLRFDLIVKLWERVINLFPRIIQYVFLDSQSEATDIVKFDITIYLYFKKKSSVPSEFLCFINICPQPVQVDRKIFISYIRMNSISISWVGHITLYKPRKSEYCMFNKLSNCYAHETQGSWDLELSNKQWSCIIHTRSTPLLSLFCVLLVFVTVLKLILRVLGSGWGI